MGQPRTALPEHILHLSDKRIKNFKCADKYFAILLLYYSTYGVWNVISIILLIVKESGFRCLSTFTVLF